MNKVLLIDIELLKEQSLIEQNVDTKTIRITLNNVQETILQPLLTEELYLKIIAGVSAGTLDESYKAMVRTHVWPVLVAGVTLHITDNLVYKLSQVGVNKDKAEGEETISQRELAIMKKEKERQLQFFCQKLQDHLEKNKSQFPEYESKTKSDDTLDIGFFLG